MQVYKIETVLYFSYQQQALLVQFKVR